ncbi:hypothetical protein OG206_02310 [Streptomyces sp. NBC_01341]|uniref:hypothetical protein n=1 Tax=Streptomyces sp. NBC_01341 TaxID=2903831 RepID=UPI002E0E6F9D|nr:hypothetical protein OG206_02310 [Streptomyces sp. NBC_01341]
MGIFGKRRTREERAAEIAGQVAEGRGFYGRTTRAFLGKGDFARVQQSMGTYNSGIAAQQLLASGAPAHCAVVVSVVDTGELVNFDPVVDMVVDRVSGPTGDAERISLRTIVSKLRSPRAGDRVLLVADPTCPGSYLYAGDGVTR